MIFYFTGIRNLFFSLKGYPTPQVSISTFGGEFIEATAGIEGQFAKKKHALTS